MATFNQQGQAVGYQYNADTINFARVRDKAGLVAELDKLQAELGHIRKGKVLDTQKMSEAEAGIAAAAAEAKKPAPDKSKVAASLETASRIFSGVAALGGLALAVRKAVEMAQEYL